MKRILASALIIGVSTFGMIGCEQKSEVTDQKTVKTPNGEDNQQHPDRAINRDGALQNVEGAEQRRNAKNDAWNGVR